MTCFAMTVSYECLVRAHVRRIHSHTKLKSKEMVKLKKREKKLSTIKPCRIPDEVRKKSWLMASINVRQWSKKALPKRNTCTIRREGCEENESQVVVPSSVSH